MRIKLATGIGGKSPPKIRRENFLSGKGRMSGLNRARRFFEHFMTLEENHDPALAGLYADRARVILSTTSARGVESRQHFSGCQWKWRLSERLGRAGDMGDGNVYSGISYQPLGQRILIRADRYSRLGGYTDHSYYMILQENAEGRLQIVEENSLKIR